MEQREVNAIVPRQILLIPNQTKDSQRRTGSQLRVNMVRYLKKKIFRHVQDASKYIANFEMQYVISVVRSAILLQYIELLI